MGVQGLSSGSATGWLVLLRSRELQPSAMHGLSWGRHFYPHLCLWALSEGSSDMMRL